MKSFGEIIKNERKNRNLLLRHVATAIDVDQALISKFEKGDRKPTKKHVVKFAELFNIDKDQLIVAWLSDKVAYELQNEKLADKVLKAAEEKVAYARSKTFDRQEVIKTINSVIENDERIKRAWIFGSFAREDDTNISDIDILIEEDKKCKFNYFDLADLQFKLERKLNRKVDIGFASALNPDIANNIQDEVKLIYEKR